MSHTIILYYKYTLLSDPHRVRDEQKRLCTQLGLKGRILISGQGINGTLGGPAEAVREYQKKTESHPELGAIEWKESQGPKDAFPKLRVVVRKEIVTLGLAADEDDDAIAHKAEYIEPDELLRMYEQGEDFIIIDGRNEYEARVGRFKHAIIPEVEAFRDLPKYVTEHLLHLKHKEVVTYCTGGIRCEKFSGYLRKRGFTKVRQLHGGVHVYAEKTGGKHFDGELFVFDKRITMPVNTVNPTICSKCEYCQTSVTRFINCAVSACNKRMICCSECDDTYAHRCQDCSAQTTTSTKISEHTT